MNRNEIKLKLNELFIDVFNNRSLIITNETTANDIPGWDSVTHIVLIAAIELDFKIRFKLGELRNLKNIGDMISLIEEKIN